MKKIHELKILPKYFREVVDNKKKFEVRKNDRNFCVGDKILLREYDPLTDDGYTGRIWYGDITYILNDSEYCKKGYIIMSIEKNETLT